MLRWRAALGAAFHALFPSKQSAPADTRPLIEQVHALHDALNRGGDVDVIFGAISRRQHDVITPKHILAALLEMPQVNAALQGAGADANEARKRLRATLPEPVQGPAALSKSARWVLQSASLHAESAGRAMPTCFDLLVACLPVGYPLPPCLLEAGLERLALLSWISHGVRQVPPPSAPQTKRAVIVFHNDDYTSMEFVVAHLRQMRLSHDDAMIKMFDVHHQGRAAVVEMPTAQAVEFVAAILADGQANEMPLKVTLEPVQAEAVHVEGTAGPQMEPGASH